MQSTCLIWPNGGARGKPDPHWPCCTDHCLRVTSITLLDGFEAHHIMTKSGHKSQASIRKYTLSESEQSENEARKNRKHSQVYFIIA